MYRDLADQWRLFDAEVQARAVGDGLPAFIRAEFEAFLRCGILAHGFVRMRCDERAFCTSCTTVLQRTVNLLALVWMAYAALLWRQNDGASRWLMRSSRVKL